MLNYEKVDQWVYIDRYLVRKGFEEKKIGVNIFDKTLSLVVNYPTTNAKRPISSVYLQLLCEIAAKTHICFFPLRSLVFMGLE